MDSLRRRLDDLKTSVSGRRTQSATRSASTRRATLAQVLGGKQRRAGGQAFWHVETRFAKACGDCTIPRRAFARPFDSESAGAKSETIDPTRAMLIDIETGGFSGTPVFLIGIVPLDERPWRVHQWLARDYVEEAGILRRFAGIAARRDQWITFNGKSFDAPFLLDRATVNRVALREPALHVDLLHAARRRWKNELSDCRLHTLEREILGRTRVGDVPGCDVPDLFHHFIRTGNAAPLRPVLEHNQMDLVSCTELLVRLSEPSR